MVPSVVRPKSEFADGLRALAAIAVTVYHAALFTGGSGEFLSTFPIAGRLLGFGTLAVPVFIVLSGFVLMLPVARSESLELRGGFRDYLRRRARRILPPYFISLAIFAAVIAFVPAMQTGHGTEWDSKVPLTAGGLISHLFLVHNLNPEWIYQINGPAWSVATEWQIYFLFPLVLLPLWRRFGPAVAVGTTVVLGIAVALVLPLIAGAHPWFLGLFALGAGAAWMTQHVALPRAGLWAGLAGVVALALTVAVRLAWVYESAFGIAIALLLYWLTIRARANRPSRIGRVLSSRPLVRIGAGSYSLYLVHSPVLAAGNIAVLDVDLPYPARLAVMFLLVLPLSWLAGWIFFHLVERHFLTRHQKAIVPSAH
ncbi:acyltransferase [Rathayibacter sp. VKM Ac-2927]|uniref:acyltransferase family protein n=1 Tax=Rathayibacter sp. VKM Ac-2927 TaxID=2929478 RepID=UPI001FB3D3BB|nr:acyltransferase [Rathayibacter sp. VKM Ac-2927]MCJ1685684.1 acyltransferase [Rathayibacter sp. VKM Ac-2927]